MGAHCQGARATQRHQGYRRWPLGLVAAVSMPRDRVLAGPIIIHPDRRKTGFEAFFERVGDCPQGVRAAERTNVDGAYQTGHRHDAVVHGTLHCPPWQVVA